MVRTKQTPRGGKSQRPKGMATATFTGGPKAEPQEQPTEAQGEDTEDSQNWPDCEKKAKQGEGTAGTSKSEGKMGDQPQQAERGAEAPLEEIPPAPQPTDPKPGTNKDPTDAPTEVPNHYPTQTVPQDPEEETPPDLTDYIKSYQNAAKVWLDTVIDQEEQAYTTLFNTLQVLGDPHIPKFTEADKQQVFKCIRDRTGRFLKEDDFVLYVEKEEEQKKPRYNLTADAREALRDL